MLAASVPSAVLATNPHQGSLALKAAPGSRLVAGAAF